MKLFRSPRELRPETYTSHALHETILQPRVQYQNIVIPQCPEFHVAFELHTLRLLKGLGWNGPWIFVDQSEVCAKVLQCVSYHSALALAVALSQWKTTLINQDVPDVFIREALEGKDQFHDFA